ncbi:MAG TPA: 50S ribosomal protein L32 [Candidatus Saccharimonadia bacterium]|nr:50S ribosomal protein L32 [Candidatus Saccharimonadia bacterium]
MAVPKKRTTRTAQGQRRSHLALVPTQLIRTAAGALIPRRLKKAAELGLLKNPKKA